MYGTYRQYFFNGLLALSHVVFKCKHRIRLNTHTNMAQCQSLYNNCVGLRCVDALSLLRMLCSFFFFLLHFPTFCCVRFFSVETSANDLKLQHMVENGPSSNHNIFLEIRPMVLELEMSIRKVNAMLLSITGMTSHCSCCDGKSIISNTGLAYTSTVTVADRARRSLSHHLLRRE